MEQTLQRSYARKSGMLHHQVRHQSFSGHSALTFVLSSRLGMTEVKMLRRWLWTWLERLAGPGDPPHWELAPPSLTSTE